MLVLRVPATQHSTIDITRFQNVFLLVYQALLQNQQFAQEKFVNFFDSARTSIVYFRTLRALPKNSTCGICFAYRTNKSVYKNGCFYKLGNVPSGSTSGKLVACICLYFGIPDQKA